MRTAFRIINVAVWLAVWLGVAYSFNAFGQSGRLFGEAIIPAILCFVIDRGIRGRRPRTAG